MIWIKTPRVEAWACSECAWTFNPSGPPRGSDLAEMKQNYELQRDKEYASHACSEHPKAKTARDGS
jgi:rubredoxin